MKGQINDMNQSWAAQSLESAAEWNNDEQSEYYLILDTAANLTFGQQADEKDTNIISTSYFLHQEVNQHPNLNEKPYHYL